MALRCVCLGKIYSVCVVINQTQLNLARITGPTGLGSLYQHAHSAVGFYMLHSLALILLRMI